MAREKQLELTFHQHIADYLLREHKYGVPEQSDITDTERFIAEDQLCAHPVGTDPSLNLVAVLRGDANGSWKPVATASYDVLPDDYFTDVTTGLVGLHPDTMSAAQFGL